MNYIKSVNNNQISYVFNKESKVYSKQEYENYFFDKEFHLYNYLQRNDSACKHFSKVIITSYYTFNSLLNISTKINYIKCKSISNKNKVHLTKLKISKMIYKSILKKLTD